MFTRIGCCAGHVPGVRVAASAHPAGHHATTLLCLPAAVSGLALADVALCGLASLLSAPLPSRFLTPPESPDVLLYELEYDMDPTGAYFKALNNSRIASLKVHA